jgi:VanZ family protein
MALIFFLSAQPDLAPTHGFWETLVRKLVHVLEYFVLSLCWIRALWGLGLRDAAAFGGAAVIVVAWAASDELHQRFVHGREGTPRDVLIDAIGVMAAVALARRYQARRRRSTGPSRPRAA